MTITCAIIDDEPLAIRLLEDHVSKVQFLRLEGSYDNSVDALAGLNEHPVDLLFLDIQMPELNGLELAHIIAPDTRIVFTTAFKQYALDSYEANAIDYLLKPISFEQFMRAANKALQWFGRNTEEKPKPEEDPKSIFVRSDYMLVRVELKKILFINGMKDYIRIFTEDEPHPVVSHMMMKTIEDLLPASEFIRVHRSYIVSLSHIKAVANNRIIIGKEYIPLSDAYRDAFLARL